MSFLSQVTKGPSKRPHFVLIYGVDGVGKSSFAAAAPEPIFLGPEDGLGLLDVAKFPPLKTWADVKAAIGDLIHEDHPYQSLAIDSLDWMEPLVWGHVIKESGVTSIEEVGGGFGKGYVEALAQWQEFIRLLQTLRAKMSIVAIAHAQIKTFDDPHAGEKFDRYQLKLNEKASALWREAADCVLFANFKTAVAKAKGASKAKAWGDGTRVMFTERRPAFDAKNRFDLPFEMPLSWEEFATHVEKAVPSAKADELLALFKGREADATAYLVSIGWLLDGQALADLKAKHRKTIFNRSDDFLQAVAEFVQTKTETTATHE